MFFLKSAFWLSVAFIVMSPGHMDLGTAASDLSQQALAAGQTLIVSQILNTDCALPACPAATVTGFPSVDTPMHDSSSPVPLPRPRPARMG